MSTQTEQSKKTIASELARLICSSSQDNLTMETLIQQLKADPARPKKSKTRNISKPAEAIRVGIWEHQDRNGVTSFVRDSKKIAEWPYWAKIHEILPKTAKKRIVMLGESVARGYLFDPYYCPAGVLENTLNDTQLLDCEVIDLARTNLDLNALIAIGSECINLQPDAIVIFAGNNWFYSAKRSLTKSDYATMINMLETEGLKELENFLVAKFRSLIINFLDKISTISNAAGNIPIIFLIPEFNLIDWKSSVNENIPTYLPNEDLREWVANKKQAQDALASGDLESACSIGEKLIEIDCSHPLGYEIIADCKLKQGLLAEARMYFESARDTAVFTRALSKPRTHAIVRETLLQESGNYNVRTVDLPQIFGAHDEERLPGRNLFLDYCHLSEEGIQLAMSAAARELVWCLTKKDLDLSAFKAYKFKPDSDVKAIACLCAAVHNAHYGQTHDVLDYLCKTAVETSPAAIEIMTGFVDFASRRASTTLCKSHEKLVENELIKQYGGGIGFLHHREQKIMDLAVVNAMIGALKGKGIDVSGRVEALRKQEHSVNHRKINLLESFYKATAYDTYPGRMPSYYQSRNLESAFSLIADAKTPINLKITFRTPNRSSINDKVKLFVNGFFIADLDANKRWATHTCSVSGDNIIDGLNEIKLVWSTTFEFGKNERKMEISEDFILSKLFHVYGEIILFSAAANAD